MSKCMESASTSLMERDRVKTERSKKAVGGGMRLRDAAKVLGISANALYDWSARGRLKATLVHEGRGRGYLVIPEVEVRRLEESLNEERESADMIKGEAIKLAAAANLLKIPCGRLVYWHYTGRLRATLVHEWRGRRHTYLAIPKGEVENLEKGQSNS